MVHESVANGLFVDDKDGSWIFSGKGNSFDYGRRERMLTKTYKEFFGIIKRENTTNPNEVSSNDEY